MKQKLLFLALSTGLSGFVIWIYVVTQITADLTNYAILSLFFTSLTVWVSALLSSLLFLWRLKSSNGEIIYAHVKPSLRQGIICAVTLSLILLLKMFNLVGFWEILLVVIGASLFEIAFSSKKKLGHTL